MRLNGDFYAESTREATPASRKNYAFHHEIFFLLATFFRHARPKEVRTRALSLLWKQLQRGKADPVGVPWSPQRDGN